METIATQYDKLWLPTVITINYTNPTTSSSDKYCGIFSLHIILIN